MEKLNDKSTSIIGRLDFDVLIRLSSNWDKQLMASEFSHWGFDPPQFIIIISRELNDLVRLNRIDDDYTDDKL